MAKSRMRPGWERAVREHVRPAMQDLGDEILAEWKPTIHVVTGEMRDSAYAEVDENATLTVGSETKDGHAFWEEIGNSHRPGHPTLLPVVNRYRGERRA